MASRFVLPFADVGQGIIPSDGAKLFFFVTGTSTPKDTFSDAAGTIPNANPVIADASGVFADIFIDGSYKVQLKDKNDVQIWEADPVDEFALNANVRSISNNDKRYGPVFATVAAMKAVSPVSIDGIVVDLQPGMTIHTQEYATGNDGGATYIVAASGSPDEFADHTLGNANIAILQVGDTLNVLRHGLSPNLADNQSALDAFINYWIPSDRRAYVPSGLYVHSGRMLIDVTKNPNRRLPELFGDTPYGSKFNTSTQVAPAFHIFGSAAGPDHFQGKLSRIGFECDLPGIGFAIGLGDFSDNHGNYVIDQCFFANFNSTSNAAAESLQLNWLFDCTFNNNVVIGKPNFGRALVCRKVHFCSFVGGSYSNAFYGILFEGADSFSNTFTVPDLENITIGISSLINTSHHNRFITPYIDIRDPIGDAEPVGGFMLDIQQGNVGGFTFEDITPARAYSFPYTGSGFISGATNHNLVNVKGRYSGQTTPAVPASDIAITNTTGQTQKITIWGGTVSDIFLNGVQIVGFSSGQVELNPGEFIAVRYTVLPTWLWQASH